MPIKANLSEQVLIDLINSKKTCSEILKELNVSKSCLYRYLRDYNLSIPNYWNSLKFDNTVFDIINNEEKAYWLGFLYADGYVSNGKYNNSVELSLCGSDKDHLIKFRKFLKDSRGVKISKSCKNHTRCRVLVTDKHFRERLIELGCSPNKSLVLKFPDLSIFSEETLVYPFIRGYIDGDGTLTNTKTNRLVVELIGTREFLTGVQSIFPEFKSLHSTDSSKRGKNNFSISCSCNKADIVVSKLYKNATIYLERKFNKFAKLCRNT